VQNYFPNPAPIPLHAVGKKVDIYVQTNVGRHRKRVKHVKNKSRFHVYLFVRY